MGQPEKEDKKEPEHIEIIADIEDYQKRMQSQWESAKSSYEEKINHLLEDFVEQTKQRESETAHVESDKNKKALSQFSEKESDNRLESLFNQAEKALRSIEKKAKDFTNKKSDRPRVINIDWATDRPTRSKRGLFFLLGTVGAASLAYFYYFTIPQVSSLPYAHTAGVVIDHDKIYIPDWFRRSLYVHKPVRGLPIVSIESLPNDFLTGLAISPGKIWSANSVTAQILEHSRSVEHPVENRIASPGKNPMGLFFDGTDLWSVDDIEKKIYRHRGNDIEEIKETFSLPNLPLSGFAMADNRAWILNKKSRELYVFS